MFSTTRKTYFAPHGYTLIEMNVVIIILLLLAGLVVPNFVAMRRSRNLYDIEAAIVRAPLDVANEAKSSQKPVRLRVEGSALVLERMEDENNAQEVKRVNLGSEIQVQSLKLNEEASSTDSWKWIAYPDGSSDSGGIEFLVGNSPKALVLYPDSKALWTNGSLPDTIDDHWTAGDLQQRAN